MLSRSFDQRMYKTGVESRDITALVSIVAAIMEL